MPDIAPSAGLRTIFSIFLGLMLTAFVGIGVYTFHPPPTEHDSRIRELNSRERGIRGSRPSSELTTADRDELEEIRSQRSELLEAAEEARKPWSLSTSVILIIFSTLALVVSLIRADQLQVISNGLLLGGVFTMLYGVGWTAFTGTSIIRFLVMTVALVVTLGLGYVRFVRRGRSSPATEGAGAAGGGVPADLERRLRELEGRMSEAARALGRTGNDSRGT
jgi:hypothetical protein